MSEKSCYEELFSLMRAWACWFVVGRGCETEGMEDRTVVNCVVLSLGCSLLRSDGEKALPVTQTETQGPAGQA